MKWIDTHCHMDHKQFILDGAAVLDRARAAGMEAMIIPAITWESNFTVRQCELLSGPDIFLAAGIHPNHVQPGQDLTGLEGLLDGRTVAIGETGLDFFRTREEEKQALQRFAFRAQIDLALEHSLPLILHVRDAWQDALAILKSYGCTFSGVAHCFTGSWTQAEVFMDLGFALGIGGTVTKGNPDLEETVRKMPSDRLLLETDAPFLAPKGCKGRNTPETIPLIAETIARLRRVSPEEIMDQTTQNARRIFRLP